MQEGTNLMFNYSSNTYILLFVLLIGCFYCPFLAVKSMMLQTEWVTLYGGANYEDARCLVETVDGSFVLTGLTYSLGDPFGDVWLIKTDMNGNELWTKTYGGADYEEARCLVETDDGGFALAGYTASEGDPFGDFWLVRTDAEGNMLWNQTYGGTSWDEVHSLVETDDGGFAMTGLTCSYGYAGTGDVWLVRTDAEGNMLWNQTYGGTSWDESNSLIETTDGGFAILGKTSSFGSGWFDLWLIKTDLYGNEMWNKTYGGSSKECGFSLVGTVDGGFAVAGCTFSFGEGSSDVWLVRTDAEGNMLWNQTYGALDSEEALCLVGTVDGGFAVAGYTFSFGEGSSDVWLVRTDAEGNMLWNQTYGGSSWDGGFSLVETADGGFVVTGQTYSFNDPSGDVLLIKFESEIPNKVPVGAFSYYPLVSKDDPSMVFNANMSYDPDGTIVMYEWDWDSDSVFDEVYNEVNNISHVFDCLGEHTITLRVTDNNGLSATYSDTVSVSMPWTQEGFPLFVPLSLIAGTNDVEVYANSTIYSYELHVIENSSFLLFFYTTDLAVGKYFVTANIDSVSYDVGEFEVMFVGDLNGDFKANRVDLNMFVDSYLDHFSSGIVDPCIDYTLDGSINFDDVNAFVCGYVAYGDL
jgi:hypothetical protein